VRTLLGEDDPPVVVAQPDERAVVVEVEELVARAGCLQATRHVDEAISVLKPHG
jgi:hypothetical protein